MTYVRNDDTITIEELLVYAKALIEDQQISPDVGDMLIQQMRQLETIYGKAINRGEAARIVATQLEMTRTGYFQTPVGITEFMESSEFMNQRRYVRPAIMRYLEKLWENPQQYDHIILGGGIGTGKNYFLDMSFSYILYRLSCMYSPQAHFGLAPGSDIVFLFQSRNYEAAKKIVYNQFKQRIEASKYFAENFMFSKRSTSELKFPNHIVIKPISSTDTAALSMNVLVSAIDECNFLNMIKRKKSHTTGPGQETYDQAQKLYEIVKGRIDSRYKTTTGTLGKIFLLSSANYKGDFIDKMEEDALTNPRIFVMHMSQWESNPSKYSKERFYVKLPTQVESTVMQDEKPDNLKGWIEVPKDLKAIFTKSPEESLRSIAGIAIEGQHKFIRMSDVERSNVAYSKIYGSPSANIFTKESVVINYVDDLKTMIDWKLLKYLGNSNTFSVHIDLGLNTDSGGIAIAHVIGVKRTSDVLDEGEAEKTLPIYGVPGIIAIAPPINEAENIDILKIHDLIILLGKHINIKYVTLDSFQSASSVMVFRKHGFSSSLVSVDKTIEPYTELKMALRSDRLFIPKHVMLLNELKYLNQDTISGKVDHLSETSKDIADSVAGSVFHLSMLRTTHMYRDKLRPIVPGADSSSEYIPPEEEDDAHRGVRKRNRRPRFSTGRRSMYR